MGWTVLSGSGSIATNYFRAIDGHPTMRALIAIGVFGTYFVFDLLGFEIFDLAFTGSGDLLHVLLRRRARPVPVDRTGAADRRCHRDLGSASAASRARRHRALRSDLIPGLNRSRAHAGGCECPDDP